MNDADLEDWQKLALEQGLHDGVVVRCPCGEPVALGEHHGDPAVLHKLPLCKPFEEKKPDEYATYVRREMIKAMGGEVGA